MKLRKPAVRFFYLFWVLLSRNQLTILEDSYMFSILLVSHSLYICIFLLLRSRMYANTCGKCQMQKCFGNLHFSGVQITEFLTFSGVNEEKSLVHENSGDLLWSVASSISWMSAVFVEDKFLCPTLAVCVQEILTLNENASFSYKATGLQYVFSRISCITKLACDL